MGRLLAIPALAIAALVAHACSGSDGGGGGGGGKPGDGTSGVDVASYEASAPVGASGGTVSLPGGPSIAAPAGSADTPYSIGIRPSGDPPGTPAGWQAATGWYDVGLTRSDVEGSAGAPIELRIPVVPPPGSEEHPGLQLLARVRGMIVAVDGAYDAATGTYVARVLGLPPVFSVTVAFNPNVVRIGTMPEPLEYAADLGAVASAVGEGWPTVEWVIDYDGQTLTEDEAANVLAWAKGASQSYSDAGLLSPFLFKVLYSDNVERWHVNLIAAGSVYDPNVDSTATDLARRFGRINLAVADIRMPTTNDYGGGASTTAHELFHAVFASYGIPKTCYEYDDNGTKYCYETHSGFNEGLATAIGYALEQGAVKPRPYPSWTTLERPHGFFSVSDHGAAYQNQDFYVYLLRMGSLDTVRRYLLALKGASIAEGATVMDALAAYAKALDAGDTGFPDPFHKVYALYAADRAYIRTSAGHIWPSEPVEESPGKANMWAPALFPSMYEVQPSDCTTTAEEAICTVTLKDVPPLAARGVFLDMAARVPEGTQMAGMSAKLKVDAGGGQVSFWIFGEKDGEGADEGRAGSLDGAEVSLKDALSKWNMARILVVHGASPAADLKVTISLSASDLSEACLQTAEWMCKCQSAGAQYGCMVYQYTVKQMCATGSAEGGGCDSQCNMTTMSYVEAYGADDPTLWNSMCPNNPK
jgi:hypothetical protein